MSILPLQPVRVTDLMQSGVANQQISSIQSQLLQVQDELSTGKQVNQPSDNPAAASMIMSLQNILNQQQNYSDNINDSTTQLNTVGSTLQSVNNLLLQAQNIASADVGSATSSQQQQGDAQVINNIISEMQNLANTNSNGVYVFGGDKANAEPYISGTGGIQFVGTGNLIQNTVDQNSLMPTEVSGANIFGGLSSGVVGSANLAPAVTAQTALTDLGGATSDGFAGGAIQLSNGTITKTVDLSSAVTLGDVVSAINAAGVGGITASLSTTGIDLTGAVGDNITVTDASGTPAEQLGIATGSGGAGLGTPVTGSNLNAKVSLFTPLSDLLGGSGLDPAGFVITNGSVSKTITPPAGGDVESLLNAINGAGLGVVAQINSSGTGINVFNSVQGTDMTIGENGGSTATELGIRTFSGSTSLSQLNNGQGVGTAPSGGGDFTITASSGSSFTVSISGAKTVQDVINDINTAAGSAGVGVSASLATSGNGIDLTDTTGGSGAFSLTAINDSEAAADLGLTAPASGNTIDGTDVSGVQVSGIFTDLSALATALQTGNANGITAAGTALQADYNRAVDAGGVAGAQVQALQDRQSQLSSENLATQTMLSSVQDVNMTSAITQFQQLQTALEASLQTIGQTQSVTLLNFIAT
jgi:flagellar hook-associated protein 3 FlgL